MKCSIQTPNVKTLAKAIHSLARISDEVYLETKQDGISLRAVNSSRSAYACFKFSTVFFASFNNRTDVKCKIPIRCLLLVFKSPSTIEKTVDLCSLELNENSDNLIMQIYCKHDLIKSYQLCLIDSEALEAEFDKENYNNVIQAESKMLLKSVQNFHSTVEEVTLIATKEKVIMKNYTDDEPDPNQIIHTELILEYEEFDCYKLDQEATVTFCLKELKAVISFAESCNVSIQMHFQTAGRPVVFNITGIPGVEAEFVLATLSDQIDSQSSITTSTQQTSNITESASQLVAVQKCRNEIRGPVQGLHDLSAVKHEKQTSLNNVEMEPENEDDAISSTPPSKKFRSKFLGLSNESQSSQYTTVMPDPDEILAEASDDEW